MDNKFAKYYDELGEAILGLDGMLAEELAHKMIADGCVPQEAINKAIKPTAVKIDEKFRRDEFFLPQLMLAGQILETAMNIFLESIPVAEHEAKRLVVIGTVKGDIHTIGKNVVSMMLVTGGFAVYDLGVDIDADVFISEAVARKADIIALSSLLTTTMCYQQDVIQLLKAKGLREHFKVIVGGGPVTKTWADEIGADGFGNDAAEGLAVARQLMAEKKSGEV